MKKNEKKSNNIITYIIAITLCILPIVLWSFTKKSYLSKTSILAISRSIGNICGIIGVILFSYTLVLSTLFKSYKNFNYLYSSHHLLGKISAIFIIFHPFLLSARFFYHSFQRGISFIFHNHLGVIFGEIALVGTILLIVLSLSKKLPKNLWKSFHKLFSLLFILIICHILFTKNDLLKNIVLKIYLYSIMFGSLGYIIYEIIRKKISKNIHK